MVEESFLAFYTSNLQTYVQWIVPLLFFAYLTTAGRRRAATSSDPAAGFVWTYAAVFAVETVRSLIDRDIVVPRGGRYVLADPATLDLDAVGAPASLQALIAARLDALSAPQRRVVDRGCILGQTFSRESIEAMCPDVTDLDDVVRELVRLQILRVEDSRFHRALHVSYPNEQDLAFARRAGIEPGGDVMIHGLPNGEGWVGEVHRSYDWTNGCIAVTDDEMSEIWELVDDGTPIEIRP